MAERRVNLDAHERRALLRQRRPAPPDVQGVASDLIRRFWQDEEINAALTSKTAQREKSDELTVQGNVYFLMFRQEGGRPTRRWGPRGSWYGAGSCRRR